MGRISRDNVPLIKLWCTANLFNNVSVFFFLSSYTYLEKNLYLYFKIVKPIFKKETFNHSQLYGSKIVGCLQICFYEKLPLHNLMNLKKMQDFPGRVYLRPGLSLESPGFYLKHRDTVHLTSSSDSILYIGYNIYTVHRIFHGTFYLKHHPPHQQKQQQHPVREG